MSPRREYIYVKKTIELSDKAELFMEYISDVADLIEIME
jgi:hypothetical protein